MRPFGSSASPSRLADPRAPAAKQLGSRDLVDAHMRQWVDSVLSMLDGAAFEQQIIAGFKLFLG
jgi:hypothetical protein